MTAIIHTAAEASGLHTRRESITRRRRTIFPLSLFHVFTAVVLSALLLPVGAAHAQDPDERLTVIHAGKIITIAGKEIENGTIVLSGGKVQSVGKDITFPLSAKVI